MWLPAGKISDGAGCAGNHLLFQGTLNPEDPGGARKSQPEAVVEAAGGWHIRRDFSMGWRRHTGRRIKRKKPQKVLEALDFGHEPAGRRGGG